MEERHRGALALFTAHHMQARGAACLVDQMNLYNISNPPSTLFSQCNSLRDNRPFTHTALFAVSSTLRLHHSPTRQTPGNFVLLDTDGLATKHADFRRPQRRFTIITSFSFDRLLALQHARLCDRQAGVSRQRFCTSPLSQDSVFHIPLMQISARIRTAVYVTL
jgi:hypothetical protein